MNIYKFEVKSKDNQNLYDDVEVLDWDATTNNIHITFKDTNLNYLTLIDIFTTRAKQNITIDVFDMFDENETIRYYELELLPMTYIQSLLVKLNPNYATIKATFKILKSEVNFVGFDNE